MTSNAATMAAAAAEYLSGLSADERVDQQPEVLRFVRWFGPDLTPHELGLRAVETYQNQVEATGADVALRLAPLRGFLRFLEVRVYIDENLAKHIKVRRATSSIKKGNTVETVENEAVKLTPEGYKQLEEELERLTTQVRPQISAALLEARRDKDIRENAPYHAAKDQQGMVEARIRELEHTLSGAEILGRSTATPGGRVTIGSTVVLRDLDYDEEVCYTLVSPSEANPREGKLSVASPVGKAVLDSSEGAVVEAEAPAGKMRYRVEKVER
jgi:transcription elongation factor GreA